MKQIILGTAGHIDHGKTSLIKALTGINTDRLKEEQERGITIELGFTSLELPNNQLLGIIDVPGHEKFIKNMVAGATGIDIVAMIIAADEGIMPQTKEHMEICSLLEIKFGVIVLTKIDTVDNEWIELVKEEIIEFTKRTFLRDAPIISVSSTTGQGLNTFIKELNKLCNNIPERPSSGIFRLPVDRVFTMKGFGTVVTGTLVSGKISVGDSVCIYPCLTQAKVRGLQVHNKATQTTKAGIRTAINFQGLGKNEVWKGNVIAIKNTLIPSYMADLLLTFLKSNRKKLKSRTMVRFHSGTIEIIGRIILLDKEELSPGDICFAQIHFENKLAFVKNDRFVIRSCSPINTIGGGKILNPIPKKHKRFDLKTITGLEILSKGSMEKIIKYHIKLAGTSGISFNALMVTTCTTEKNLNLQISLMLSKKSIIQVEKNNRIYIHIDTFKILVLQIEDNLRLYHNKYPMKLGMSKEELKSQFSFNISTKLFTSIINWMVKNKKILIQKEAIKLYDYSITLKIDQKQIKSNILKIYKDNGLMPPYFKNIVKDINIKTETAKQILELLVNEKKIVKIKDELYYHETILNKLEQKLINFLIKNKEITTSQFKEMTTASRKYTIPLIEYFDSIKVTIRIGEIRKLRKKINLS